MTGRKIIKHKIRKGSVFQILNDPSYPRNQNPNECYFVFLFLTNEVTDKKIKKDIRDFVKDNEKAYGNWALIHDIVDVHFVSIFSHTTALIEVNYDGNKKLKFNSKEREQYIQRCFDKEIAGLVASYRTKQKTIIITASDKSISPKISQNADFVFAPKRMKLDEKWSPFRLIRY